MSHYTIQRQDCYGRSSNSQIAISELTDTRCSWTLECILPSTVLPHYRISMNSTLVPLTSYSSASEFSHILVRKACRCSKIYTRIDSGMGDYLALHQNDTLVLQGLQTQALFGGGLSLSRLGSDFLTACNAMHYISVLQTSIRHV